MDLDVLASLRHREQYETYGRFVKPSSLSEIGYSIFTGMGEWLQHNQSATEINWNAFSAWYTLVRHAKLSKDKLQAHKHFISALEAHETNETNLRPLMEGLAQRDYAAKIGDAALRIADGDFSLDMGAIEKLVEEYKRHVGKLDSHEKFFGNFDLASLDSVSMPGLEWRLRSLNLALGDVRQGDLIVVGKRPDTGGTTLLASEMTYMGEQVKGTGQSILWFNNEEQGNKVRRRIVQAGTGWTTEQLRDMKGALALYDELIGTDTIMVYDRARIHVKDVESICEEMNPAFIVFDQLHKVHGFDQSEGNEATRQTLLFNWARELAKDYAPVIAVHQAGGEAENVKWINMAMLYGAKTGPQGEADVILTLGRTHNSGNTRFLYVPKNKLLTPGDPTLRNGKFEIELVADIARFQDYV